MKSEQNEALRSLPIGVFDSGVGGLTVLRALRRHMPHEQFIYLGAGLELEKIQPDSVIAYSPTENKGYRAVLLADGSVQQLNSRQFEERSRLGWILRANPQQIAQNQQLAVVRGAQFQPATVQPLAPANPTTPAIQKTMEFTSTLSLQAIVSWSSTSFDSHGS